MARMLTTRQVAQLLNVNEKMVYSLVADKKLPATKITGKWMFPQHLVEQWVEANTINYPDSRLDPPSYEGVLILAGSNDPLMERAIHFFNQNNDGHLAVFGNVGSLGGLQALRQNRCHIAASHLLQDDESEYNFDYAAQELDSMPAVVNFAQREQGLLLGRDNPHQIASIGDLAQPHVRIVNRPLGTGTRLLLDRELKKAGLPPESVNGYQHEVHSHFQVGLEILSGRADAGPGIRAIAGMLDLKFLPLRWERYDLLIAKPRFFDPAVQVFLSLLRDAEFVRMASEITGYDLRYAGKMRFRPDTLRSARAAGS